MKKLGIAILAIFLVLGAVVGAGMWYVNSLLDEVIVTVDEEEDAVDVMPPRPS